MSKKSTLDVQNAEHIRILNEEVGMLRDAQNAANEHFEKLATKMDSAQVAVIEARTDIVWLKKAFWVIAASSVGSLCGSIFQQLFQ